jgi:hypothetical protein
LNLAELEEPTTWTRRKSLLDETYEIQTTLDKLYILRDGHPNPMVNSTENQEIRKPTVKWIEVQDPSKKIYMSSNNDKITLDTKQGRMVGSNKDRIHNKSTSNGIIDRIISMLRKLFQ